jgi:hypothetical protein
LLLKRGLAAIGVYLEGSVEDVVSLQATAMRATSFDFPAATSLSQKLLRCGLQRAATMAPTNKEASTTPNKIRSFFVKDALRYAA